jgi:hypothetical protein
MIVGTGTLDTGGPTFVGPTFGSKQAIDSGAHLRAHDTIASTSILCGKQQLRLRQSATAIMLLGAKSERKESEARLRNRAGADRWPRPDPLVEVSG